MMQNVDQIMSELDRISIFDWPKMVSPILDDFLIMLNKQSYSEEEKAFIVDFLEKGLFDKLVNNCTIYPVILDKILIIKQHYQYKLGIESKVPGLVEYSKRVDNTVLLNAIERIIDSNAPVPKEAILSTFLRADLEFLGSDKVISIINKETNQMSFNYLRQSAVFQEIIRNIQRDYKYYNENGDKYAKKRISNIIDCFEDNLLKGLLRGEEIDLRNDELIKVFPSGKNIKSKEKDGSISIDTLNFINSRVAKLIKKAHESSNYAFSESEKTILQQYFNDYYPMVAANFSILEKNGQIDIFKQLANVYKNTFDLEETNSFFFNMFDWKNFENVLIQNSDNENALNILADLANNSAQISKARMSVFINYYEKKSLNNQNPFESQCINTLLRNIIDNHASLNKTQAEQIDPDQHQLIINYVNIITDPRITQKENYNILKEQSLCDIMQLLYSNRFPDNIKNAIESILEKNLHVSKINSKSEKNFLNEIIVQNSIITDEETLDTFVEHLGKIKLKEKRIDTDNRYIKFILKQILNKDSAICKNPEKYQFLLERAIEDLGRNDLSSKISQDNYCYFIRDYFTKESIDGLHYPSQKILLKRERIKNLITNQDFGALDILFHENTHANQNYEIYQSEEINYYKYLMLKEQIIRSWSEDFYKKNYWFSFNEIEAREQGTSKAKSFLENIFQNLTKKERVSFCDSVIQGTFDFFAKRNREEKSNYKKGFEKIDTLNPGDKRKEVELIFDELIRNHPEILRFSQYQGLLREYNQNGTKKRISQILPEMEQTKGNRDLHLYSNILIRGNIFKPVNYVEDLQYLINHENNDKRSCWINSEILNHLALHVANNIDLIPKDQLNDYVRMINELTTRINEIKNRSEEQRTYTDKKIITSFERRDKETNKTLIDVLLETKQKIIEERKIGTTVTNIGTNSLNPVLDDSEKPQSPNIDSSTSPQNYNSNNSHTNFAVCPEMILFLQAEREVTNEQKKAVLKDLNNSAQQMNTKSPRDNHDIQNIQTENSEERD